MQHEIKQQITAAANAYLSEKGLSQADLARRAKVNPSYLSGILRGTYTVETGDKTVEIADKWFAALAETIGFTTAAGPVWPSMPTPQMQEIIAALQEAKETGVTKTLIGESGSGKTYAVELFVRKVPQHTYKITLSALMKMPDILGVMLDKLGLDHTGRPAGRLARITAKLREIRQNGGRPILILDEAENVELPTLKMLKAMFDGVKDHCAIVLVGTSQLTQKLLRMKAKNRDSVPQFYRRFRAGIRVLPAIDGRFGMFYEQHGIEKPLQRLLNDLCDNYGELADYLEPALREATNRGEPLTEQLFRIIYNLPA